MSNELLNERVRLSLRTAPLRWITRVTLLANGKIQRGRILAATVTDSGDGLASLDHIARRFQQGLIVAVQTQITVAVVENDQQARATQPVGKHHATTVDSMYLAAGRSADHHTIPLGPGIVTPTFAEACQQSTINRPGKFSPG
ncbi:hypothetical protein D3C84_884700 [compost metagenome]